MKNISKYYPLSILVMIAIVWLSLGNPPDSNLKYIANIDKIVHFCMYGGLTMVIWFEYLLHHDTLEWKKLVLFALLAPIVFSGAMEIAQKMLTIYRQADWADFLANSLGVLCGLMVALLIIRPIVWNIRKKRCKC